MTSFRAVVTDLDGTIVRDDNTISDATRRAVAELAAAGIPLVVATARTPAGLDVLGNIAAHVPVAVCCNGSIGYVPATREFRWRHTLSPVAVRTIAEVLGEHLPGAGIAVYDGQRWTLTPAYAAARDKLPRGPRRIVPARDLPADGICAMAVAESSLASPDIASVLASAGVGSELAVISYAAADVLDIAPPGIDKGVAPGR